MRSKYLSILKYIVLLFDFTCSKDTLHIISQAVRNLYVKLYQQERHIYGYSEATT